MDMMAGMVEVELPRGELVTVPVGAAEVFLPGGRTLRMAWSQATPPQLASFTVLEPENGGAAARPRVVWSAREGQIEPVPASGALLRYRPAIEREWSDTWFASVEAAKAELSAIAEQYGGDMDDNGMSIGFTAAGCAPSWADVVPIQRTEASAAALLTEGA